VARRVYAVVDTTTGEREESLVRREEAETFIEEVREDEPELAEALRIEPAELDA
jgi:hypothetical protein